MVDGSASKPALRQDIGYMVEENESFYSIESISWFVLRMEEGVYPVIASEWG